MVESVSCFGTLSPLPPEPKIIGTSVLAAGPPIARIGVEFDQTMDTGFVPAFTSWDFVLDGVPTAVSSIAWQSSTVLRVEYAGGPPASTGDVRLLTTDTGLRSVGGSVPKAPKRARFFP